MTYHRPFRQSISSVSTSPTSAGKEAKQVLALVTLVLVTLTCPAQDQPQTGKESDQQQSQAQEEANNTTTVTVPAGTRIALVLTQPIQSRDVHRGDDIYAQITSPVNAGNQVVIPPGTFVQGKVDKLDRKGGRAELHLQSLSITFPDGYVVPLSGPVTLTSPEGYAFKDPGPGRYIGLFALPLGGAGLGALIGHAVGKADSQVASTLPPGCVGGPPFCVPITTPVFGTKGKDAIIGAGIGSAIGGLASIALLFSSRGFFLDLGSPAEMMLQQPITLPQDQVADAVQRSEQHPVPEQPVAQRPRPVPPPNPAPNNDPGICYTPGTPGTPSSVIPGVPGPDGVPGPPTIIPGTPPTPPTPHPCP